jgi:hypothetical protein
LTGFPRRWFLPRTRKDSWKFSNGIKNIIPSGSPGWRSWIINNRSSWKKRSPRITRINTNYFIFSSYPFMLHCNFVVNFLVIFIGIILGLPTAGGAASAKAAASTGEPAPTTTAGETAATSRASSQHTTPEYP